LLAGGARADRKARGRHRHHRRACRAARVRDRLGPLPGLTTPVSRNKDAAVPARTVLPLPARSAFAGRALPSEVARAMGRAGLGHGDPGDAAQLQRHFEPVPRGWPVAALTRTVDAGIDDAGAAQWLRADPAWIRPDINGARLFAAG